MRKPQLCQDFLTLPSRAPLCQVTFGDTSVDSQYADNSPGKAVKFEEEIHRKYDANIYFR
jgi:hypothetical protein